MVRTPPAETLPSYAAAARLRLVCVSDVFETESSAGEQTGRNAKRDITCNAMRVPGQTHCLFFRSCVRSDPGASARTPARRPRARARGRARTCCHIADEGQSRGGGGDNSRSRGGVRQKQRYAWRCSARCRHEGSGLATSQAKAARPRVRGRAHACRLRARQTRTREQAGDMHQEPRPPYRRVPGGACSSCARHARVRVRQTYR